MDAGWRQKAEDGVSEAWPCYPKATDSVMGNEGISRYTVNQSVGVHPTTYLGPVKKPYRRNSDD